MLREMGLEEMGLPYVPFSFPTVTVRNNMEASAVKASNAEVEILWNAYYDGTVNQGIPPATQVTGNAAILNYLTEKTGLTKLQAAAFLNGLRKAVNEQGMGIKYLDPAGYKKSTEGQYSLDPVETIKTAAKDLGQAAGNFIKPVADPVTNLVKYGAILVVGAAVIYGIYHGTKIFKARKKRR